MLKLCMLWPQTLLVYDRGPAGNCLSCRNTITSDAARLLQTSVSRISDGLLCATFMMSVDLVEAAMSQGPEPSCWLTTIHGLTLCQSQDPSQK